MNLKNSIITVLSAAALIIGGSSTALAQTCRVKVGVSPSGTVCYKEVYQYDFVQEKPSFPGGDSKLVEFINSTRRYPSRAYSKGVQGKVTCSFVVEANGEVEHVKVIRSVDRDLDKEAVRVLSAMPAWIPGRLDGIPVPVNVIWSVPFRK